MASMEMRADQRQQQTLSPKLQHAVRLLQLSSLDFAQEVSQALGRNPFLETEDSDDGDDAPLAALDAQDGVASPPDDTHTGDSDREVWQADALARQRHADSEDTSALDLMPALTSLAQHLHAQLTAQPLPPRDRLLAQVIVESLDDDGYLRLSEQELIEIADLDPTPTAQEFHIALKLVQSLDPAGVGARSVGECLMLQLGSIECPHTTRSINASACASGSSESSKRSNARCRSPLTSSWAVVGPCRSGCSRCQRLSNQPTTERARRRTNTDFRAAMRTAK